MEEKGFIGTMFDFSFSQFVTTKVIKFLLVIAMILAAIIAISIIVSGFAAAWWKGLIALILSPVIYLLIMLGFRIYLELIIVIFRIAENLVSIREKLTAPDAVVEETTIAEEKE